MPSTLILSRSEQQQSVDVAVLIDELREAMAHYDDGGQAQRVHFRPSDTVTATVLTPGAAPGVPAYTVKVHAKNPVRRPALTGLMCLHDLHSGDVLAVLASSWLTALRTGIGAALGAHELARTNARDIGVIGAGQAGTSAAQCARRATAAGFSSRVRRRSGRGRRVRGLGRGRTRSCCASSRQCTRVSRAL